MTRPRSHLLVSPLQLFILAFVTTASASSAQTVCYTEQAKLQPSTGSDGTQIGWSVAIDGDTLIAGAPLANGHSLDDGAAFVFVRSGATWVEQAKLFANDGYGGEQFGQSVALSGDTAVVGAWLEQHGPWGPEGAAYVFVRNGATWTQEAKLTASDGDYYNFFGVDVTIEGDTIAVGADYHNSVYVYERAGTDWPQRAILSSPVGSGLFGNSVTLEGDTLFVGSPTADVPIVDQGAVFAFVGSGANWSLAQQIRAPDAAVEDLFGTSLDSSHQTLIVGTTGDEDLGSNSGSAHVFTRVAGAWLHEAKLLSPQGAPEQLFGSAVAIAGDLAVVGAPQQDVGPLANAGAVHLFSRAAATWTPEPELTPSSVSTGDRFGISVGASGETLAAGRPFDSDAAAHVFFPFPRVGTPYCTCASGPCGNADANAGCANSTGAGALMSAQAGPTPDDTALLVSGAAPIQFGVLFEGDRAISIPFGGGFLCVAGNVVRLTPMPIQVAPGGTAAFGPCFGDPSIPSLTGVVAGSGEVRHYQFWYRDPAGPCGGGFNFSNALSIAW